jgi:hypothetical protein
VRKNKRVACCDHSFSHCPKTKSPSPEFQISLVGFEFKKKKEIVEKAAKSALLYL